MICGDWKSKWDIFSCSKGFCLTQQQKVRLEVAEILYAASFREDWVLDAYVLYRQGRSLFEVQARYSSHASSGSGLSGKWAPEEVTLEELAGRTEALCKEDFYGGLRPGLRLVLSKLLNEKEKGPL